MANKRDYYEVLGVPKNASEDDIKQAYRKAALKWHPDRWVGHSDQEKQTAEANFKEASEAYSVLSDKDKRAKYDQFGFAGVDGSAGGQNWQDININDFLRNIFGNFGGFSGFGFDDYDNSSQSSGRRTFRGRDIRTRVYLSLEEIAKGCTKEVSIERMRACPECGGKGAKYASDIKTCPTCKGSGQVRQVSQSFFGQRVNVSTCPNCNGTGQIISNPCRKCSGSGLVRVKETVKVNIPAGVENGMQLTLKGEGHGAPNGGVNGDLLVVIEELEHPKLKREGKDLFYTKVITVADAVLGCEISIPCLDGEYKLKLEPGTQSGHVEKLRGKGVGSVSSYGKGDMYVKILVWIPRKLDKQTRKYFETMQEEGSVALDPSREDKALFEKESKYY
ncbi:MAG: molecular chaperone DnaJ [Candidatus Cryptobacteroides sp.]